MFAFKKKYYLIIESIKDIDLRKIKKRGKFVIIYRYLKNKEDIQSLKIFRKKCKIRLIDFFVANNLNLAISLNSDGIYLSSYNKSFKALSQISLKLFKGETLGLIGESGSGKTTLSNAILKIHEFEKGEILFKGKDISKIKERELIEFRKNVQIIFQDPYASLNPLQNIFQIISEPIKFHRICLKNEVYEKCKELISDVGLNENFLSRYPHELSGGQRQRVCIARAISVNPEVLICDESVSALDVSI